MSQHVRRNRQSAVDAFVLSGVEAGAPSHNTRVGLSKWFFFFVERLDPRRLCTVQYAYFRESTILSIRFDMLE